MGRHAIQNIIPHRTYESFPVFQWAAGADYHQALADDGEWGEQFFADDCISEVDIALFGIQEELATLAFSDGAGRLEGLLSESMHRLMQGRHAYDPSNPNQYHPEIIRKEPHQAWIEWLANDAPRAYVYDCLVQAMEIDPAGLAAISALQPIEKPQS